MIIPDILSIICQMYSSTPLYDPSLHVKAKEHKLVTTGYMMRLAIDMVWEGNYYG